MSFYIKLIFVSPQKRFVIELSNAKAHEFTVSVYWSFFYEENVFLLGLKISLEIPHNM